MPLYQAIPGKWTKLSNMDKGNAVIPAGSQSVIVNHNLGAAPQRVYLSSNVQVGDKWWTATTTQVTINIQAVLDEDVTILWLALLEA